MNRLTRIRCTDEYVATVAYVLFEAKSSSTGKSRPIASLRCCRQVVGERIDAWFVVISSYTRLIVGYNFHRLNRRYDLKFKSAKDSLTCSNVGGHFFACVCVSRTCLRKRMRTSVVCCLC